MQNSFKWIHLGIHTLKTFIADHHRPDQWFGTGLIMVGLILMGWGTWIPLRNYWVLQQNPPPPLPVEAIDTSNQDGLPLSLSDNPLPVIGSLSETRSAATPSQPETVYSYAEGSPEQLAQLLKPPAAQSPPTRIVASTINLDSEIQPVGWRPQEINGQTVNVWDIAEYAASWHRNSALPGHQGNIVLSGHHNVFGEVFRYIVDLEPGDRITLYTDTFPYQYRVVNKFIVKDKGESEAVRQGNARWIGPFADQRLTIITCWPYNTNTHRVIVIAKPVKRPPSIRW